MTGIVYDPTIHATPAAARGEQMRLFYSINKLLVDLDAAGIIDLIKQVDAPVDTTKIWLDISDPENVNGVARAWDGSQWQLLDKAMFYRHISADYGGFVTNTELTAALASYYSAGGTDVALADGGTGASLSDPNADRILFWDDSAASMAWLTPNAGMAIDGTNLNVNGALRSVQVFTASGTWSRPAGVTRVVVEVIGGGGGGGGVSAATAGPPITLSVAAGGGGGGYAIKLITSPGSTETVTIGAGGSGGAAGNNNGSTGGTTSFGSHVSATGGGGGGFGQAAVDQSTFGPVGGAGGTGSSGDLNIAGGAGFNSQYGTGTNATFVNTGRGGAAARGGDGGAPLSGAGAGNAGAAPGGGGSGALDVWFANIARAGGNGAAGICIVWEYS